LSPPAEAALTIKPATGEDLKGDRLKARLGATLIERDLLEEKIAILEANRPLGRRSSGHEPGLFHRSVASRMAWRQSAGSGGSPDPGFIATRRRRGPTHHHGGGAGQPARCPTMR